jgi:mono/diheme cytochrome c family protein
MKRYATVSFFLLCLSIGAARTEDGLYTEEQAKQGEVAYNANCATCHGSELRSADREVPHLTDRWFRSGWVGRTVAEKFETIRDSMPPREPHSLDDQVYLDIVAYILRFNKIPAGGQPLTPDLGLLKQRLIPPPAD